MDEDLRRRDRDGATPAERLRGRLRRGDDAATAWRALAVQCADYDALVDLTRELSGFAFVDRAEYSCGTARWPIARFEHAQTGLIFCLVPGGTYLMGVSDDDARGSSDERPLHEVRVAPVLVAQTPCTQRAWDRVAAEVELNDARGFHGEDLPIERVSWDDVQVFCAATGLQLPSEAEWEWACRAGTTTTYAFGDDARELRDYAVFFENSGDEELEPETTWDLDTLRDVGGRLRPAGLKRPNAFGLHDMHGLVFEWCEDDWHETYDDAPTDGRAWVEEERQDERVRRGGCWDYEASDCRSACRYSRTCTDAWDDIGFRPVLSARPSPHETR